MKGQIVLKFGNLVLAGLLLAGCYPTTTVVLPPESTAAPSESPSEKETVVETTEPETHSVGVTEATVAQPPTEEETKPTEEKSPHPSGGQKPPKRTEQTETKPPKETVPQPSTEPPTTEPPSQPPTEPPTEPEPTLPPVYDISGHTVGSREKGMLEAMNARRREAGLPELTLDSKLSALAAIRAYECREVWSHTRPDGRKASTVLGDYDYGYQSTGENITQASPSFGSDTIVDSEMKSDNHRAHILSETFDRVGIGLYESGGMLYIAVIFVKK